MQPTVAQPGTRWPSTRVQIGYLAGVGVFTVVVLLLIDSGSIPLLAGALLAVPLGPFGLLLIVLALLGQGALAILATGSTDGTTAQQPGLLLADVIVLVAVLGVALVNVRIMTRIARSDGPNPPGYRSMVPADADRVLAGSVHLYAGLGFVLLCSFCGFTGLAAHGIDYRVSDAVAQARVVRAALTWSVGLVAAVGSLVVFILRMTSERPVLVWALGSLAAQSMLVGVMLLAE